MGNQIEAEALILAKLAVDQTQDCISMSFAQAAELLRLYEEGRGRAGTILMKALSEACRNSRTAIKRAMKATAGSGNWGTFVRLGIALIQIDILCFLGRDPLWNLRSITERLAAVIRSADRIIKSSCGEM